MTRPWRPSPAQIRMMLDVEAGRIVRRGPSTRWLYEDPDESYVLAGRTLPSLMIAELVQDVPADRALGTRRAELTRKGANELDGYKARAASGGSGRAH